MISGYFRMPTFRSLLCGWLVPLLCLQAGVARGEDAVSKEYRLKAAFLYNFTKFVDWPEQAFAAADSPLVIGVFRTNPFGSELEGAVRGRKINGRRIVVRQVSSAAAARQTHILFVGAAQDSRLEELKDALKGSPVLTVGESQAFEKQSGMITFKIQNDSLRFTIHKEPAQRVGLKISAQLQKLAAKPGGKAR
jgi:hypothetical protein